MGNEHSLGVDDVQRIQAHVPYSEKEIKRMYKRFFKLDLDATGRVSKQDFLKIPELAANPMAERMMALIDGDSDGTIDFEEFVRALAVFGPGGDPEEKLNMVFRAFDTDRDGYLMRDEVSSVLKMMVQSTMTDEQLKNVVEKTVDQADKDKDGKLSFVEFKQLLDGA